MRILVCGLACLLGFGTAGCRVKDSSPTTTVTGHEKMPAEAALRHGEVPASCTAQVNEKLASLVGTGADHVDNVMVCGVTVSSSRTQHGGRHGDHQILPLRVTMPGGNVQLVEVVTNDELDGRVTSGPGATVFAYGQAFFPTHGHFVAGIHDVHCSTHRGADDGWVVVDGRKFPSSCSR